MDDIDIWRAANIIVQRHGMLSEAICLGRAATMAERGDAKGNATWQRVIAAVRQLRQVAREAGKSLQ